MPLDQSDETAFLDWVSALVGEGGADVVVGPGDDCAVVACGGEQLLLKVDSVLEGTHFQRTAPDALGYATVAEVGNKAMLRTLSDIAAMGGIPRFALLSLGIPATTATSERQSLMKALAASAADYGVTIVGGDTKSWNADRLTISVTLIGTMNGVPPVLRSGGAAGDTLYVTGPLGGSISGKHKAPSPRLAAGRWLAEHGASAMIDLSDGLSIDLWRLCRASACGARIDAVPVTAAAHDLARESVQTAESAQTGESVQTAEEHALHDGEDYELLVAIRGAAPDAPYPLHRIGELVAGSSDSDEDPAIWWLRDGVETRLPIAGFEHRWREDAGS